MARIFMIYFVVLTAAELAFANGTSHLYIEEKTPPSMGEVVYADMKPVKADGKSVTEPTLEFDKRATEEKTAERVNASVTEL